MTGEKQIKKPTTNKLRKSVAARNIDDALWNFLEYGIKEMSFDEVPKVDMTNMLRILREIRGRDELTRTPIEKQQQGTDKELEDWLSDVEED